MEIQKLFVSLLLDAADYTGGLEDAQKEASSFRDRVGKTIGAGFEAAQVIALSAIAAIAAALLGIGLAAFNVSDDVATATANIQAELGTTAEEAEHLGDIATNVWGNNFAGSITEAAGAVGLIRQQLGELSDNELQNATENAFRLQDVFGVEVPESVDAARTLMEQFGLSSEEAFDFIAKGFQNGLNRSDDFLDTIGEYSVQFASGGADAAQFFSLLESGLQGGMLGTDKAADAFKEFRVRIQDGSDATAESLEMIGLSAEDISQQMADGSLTAADAFTMVVDGLNAIDDENIRMQAGVGLLGTQFEDLGTAGALGLSLVGTELEDMTGAVGSLDAKYNTLGSAVEGFKRRGLLAIKPVGDLLLTLANNAMPLVDRAFGLFETSILPIFEDLGSFVNGFTTELSNGLSVWDAAVEALLNWTQVGEDNFEAILNIVVGIEQFIAKAQELLQPVIDWIAGHVQLQDVLIAFGILLAATILPILASLIASILAIAAPVVAIIAVVALLRTAWEENWGGIQEKTAAAMEFIRNVITAVSEGIKAFWAANGEAIMAKAKEIWEGIKTAVNTAITTIQTIIQTISTAIQTFWQQHGDTIMAAAETAWQFIQDYIDTALSVIDSVWQAFKSAFEGDWHGFGANLREAATTAWEFIKTTFSEAGTALLAWLSGFVLDLLAKFNDTDWGAVGTNIIQGIANAIMGGVDIIKDAAKAAAQAALDAAKGLLGIESPSKVAAAQIGEPFNEGLAVGLGQIAPIQSSVADLVNEMTLPFEDITAQPIVTATGVETAVSTPTPTGERGGGDTFIFNIDAPGGDTDAIEKAVERAMAKSGRRADVRIRTR